jgi:hypothetical protein
MPMNPPDVSPQFPGLHRRIALTFRRNPKMIRAFAFRLRSRFAKSAYQMSKQHLEWYVILSLWSPMEVIKMLEDSGDRTTRLRRTSPLPFLLSEDDMSDYFSPLFAWPRFGI